MKSSTYFLVLGGFLGFTLTFLVTFLSGLDIPNILLRSSMGSIIGVILMKYFLKTFIHGVYQSRIAQSQEEHSAKESKPVPDSSLSKEESSKTQTSSP